MVGLYNLTISTTEREKDMFDYPENAELEQGWFAHMAVKHLRQLLNHNGRSADLSRDEEGRTQLSWVDVVQRLVAQPELLTQVEQEAYDLWQRGIRHIIWSGMGGSITTVKTLVQMGICAGENGQTIRIYPLDSTDPTALNTTVKAIARAKGMSMPEPGVGIRSAWIRWLLEDVMLIGVSMSKMSEEPLSHLLWFIELLDQAYLAFKDHVCVMTLQGSVLEQLAHEYHLPMLPLFLDDQPLVGRMSAPGSRIFLLPVALHFAHASERGQLLTILQQAWQWHDLDGAEAHSESHPFVQVAIALFQASTDSICRLLLTLPDDWQPFLPWIEQLMEQSLGKGGKGVVVFPDQGLNSSAPGYRAEQMLHVSVVSSWQEQSGQHNFQLVQPYLADGGEGNSLALLAALVASCLGWQVTMALYALFADIRFATEPAVESYKRIARSLRESSRLSVLESLNTDVWSSKAEPGHMQLACPPDVQNRQQIAHETPSVLFAQALSAHTRVHTMLYLDFTVNGDLPSEVCQMLRRCLYHLGNTVLGVPVKVRRAPSAYHISEQSELDGPPLVSLRVLLRDQPAPLLGTYRTRFLHAQAVATWRAMVEQERSCFFLLVDTGSAGAALESFFRGVEEHMSLIETATIGKGASV